MHPKFKELNSRLIKHYNCFNTERFFLDELTEDYAIIVSSIEDACPVRLCTFIAKYIFRQAKKLGLSLEFVYVGPWAFNVKKYGG